VGTSSVKITLVCKQCQNYIAADTEEVWMHGGTVYTLLNKNQALEIF
jgi:hypothetical protein